MRIEIKRSRYMSIFMIGLSIFYLWGVVPKLWVSIDQGELFSLKSAAFILFGSLLLWQAIRFFKHLIDKKPAIVIDETGFTDNVSNIKAGLIPWEDIAEVEHKKGAFNRTLIVKLHDPEKVMLHLSGMKENLARSLLKSAGSPLVIQDNMISYKLKDLTKLMEEKIA